jgi:hypothetical protein
VDGHLFLNGLRDNDQFSMINAQFSGKRGEYRTEEQGMLNFEGLGRRGHLIGGISLISNTVAPWFKSLQIHLNFITFWQKESYAAKSQASWTS